jgi:hypothetical protein
MAEKFSTEKKKAAWFLKNRTYVDDAQGGADIHEEARQVSTDMKDILENGGFGSKRPS